MKSVVGSITARISVETKRKFLQKCIKHGGQSEVVRILLDAYVDDRITISPKQPTDKELLK